MPETPDDYDAFIDDAVPDHEYSGEELEAMYRHWLLSELESTLTVYGPETA